MIKSKICKLLISKLILKLVGLKATGASKNQGCLEKQIKFGLIDLIQIWGLMKSATQHKDLKKPETIEWDPMIP